MLQRWLGAISAAGFAGVIVHSIAGTARHMTGIWVINRYGQATADRVSDTAIAFGWVAAVGAAMYAFWWAYHRGWPNPLPIDGEPPRPKRPGTVSALVVTMAILPFVVCLLVVLAARFGWLRR